MIVAEILVTTGRSYMGPQLTHVAKFADLEKCRAEYERLKSFVKDKGKDKNDIPREIEVVGDGNQFTVYFDDISLIGLVDFALANEQEAGVKDAFPNIFKR